MTLVPWKFCNPYANLKYEPTREFCFSGVLLKINQVSEENISIESNTGNVVWDGAYLLARYIDNQFKLTKYPRVFKTLEDLNCLELGSGTGFVGLVAWLNGANVTVTDLPSQLLLIENNIQYNLSVLSRSNIIKATPLDWTKPNLDDKFDVILCSEIIYLSSLHTSLLRTLKKFCQPKHTQILLSYKTRGLGEERFFGLAKSFGFSLEPIPRYLLDLEFQDSNSYQIVCMFIN